MKITTKSAELGGRTLTLEVGRFAEQATSAVLAKYGDTMVLVTIVSYGERPDLDYFPLNVEYVERLYAGGRIKGSRWVKREGRPSDDAVLKGRIVDRSIRPLFPKGFKNETQVIITILSVDGENDPDMLGVIATSASLAISPIPWKGPVAAVKVGYLAPQNGNEISFLTNPRENEGVFAEAEVVVTATKDKILMLEAGMNQIPEDITLKAIKYGKKEAQIVIDLINDLVKEVGKEKIPFTESSVNEDLLAILEKNYKKEVNASILARVSKENESDDLAILSDTIFENYKEKFDKKEIEKALDYLFKKSVRENILKNGKRPDGRKANQIREISSEVGLLPRTHGSAHFKRGQTQVLTVTTLGSPSLEQLIESPEGESAKRYMHHYSMPPYSVGETGRVGFPSRREIGHGALAEKAILPVLPPADKFPYAIRLVSEVMSSNGSTSMASTCGSTLSLMDAGVPIKDPVAGLAIGMMSKGDEYVLLTDIIGIEDFGGDMDFKVAGTKNGITAIQLDVKVDGITDKQVEETLEKAKIGREFILEKMQTTLSEPRKELSQYAPRVSMIMVPQEKIGEVIGPGGKVIRQIIAETGCDVNVDDDGKVTISGTDPVGVQKAYDWVASIIRVVQPNEEFEGEVKRILPFGAFVEILPGKEGMVHVSQMSTGFVQNPEAVVQLGQKVKVRVVEIDDQGRINLSMLFGEDALKNPPKPREPRPFNRRRF